MNIHPKKKDNRISGYFSSCVINSYYDKTKLPLNFIKNASLKFKIPKEICRKELKKARIRFYHRIAYLKNNKKVIYLAHRTGISLDAIIELILKDDIKMTKDGINHFINIFYYIEESLKNIKNNEAEQYNNADIKKERLTELYNFNLENFIMYLASHINKIDEKNKYIMAMELDDSIFFSIYALILSLNEFVGKYIPEFNKNFVTRRKILKLLIDEFRNREMLAANINEGYYSNTVLIYGINNKSKKAHGIFIKKELFVNLVLCHIPENYKNIKITIAKV